ncbi:Integrin-linked kinase-associated serine/threonine phosphatase 2C [Microtus ochrogaster]|uniref:Integrin-linked kinase-associated serine/threonine phosphatase 2C n=1 Tax=Microtus ochrogaster TaxID=79684 RepID=A0A8J6GE97_MICOH|nr:Integrin-linked kinase-associated serine/threonine phosphatase 2C [Microtus ochrogaster]
MDLFGDLPEPERAQRPPAGKRRGEEGGAGVRGFRHLRATAASASACASRGRSDRAVVGSRPRVAHARSPAPKDRGTLRVEAQEGSMLSENLPPAGSTDSGTVFRLSQVVKNEGKGAKRKTPEEEKNGGEELVEKKVCKASSVIFGLKGYVAERKGEREEMQDAHVILNDITEECRPPSSLITRVSYFAVFDGHGGIRASKFAAQNLHQNLIRKFPKGDVISVEKTVKRCLLDTFKHTDEEFLKQASSQKPAWKDGSTATCVLAVDNILYIANLGDSRAILCRYNEESQKHAALSLSKEHNPTQYEERMRIQKAGGNVRCSVSSRPLYLQVLYLQPSSLYPQVLFQQPSSLYPQVLFQQPSSLYPQVLFQQLSSLYPQVLFQQLSSLYPQVLFQQLSSLYPQVFFQQLSSVFQVLCEERLS